MSAVILFSSAAAAFTCSNAALRVSRPAVQSSVPTMSAEDSTRRQLFARAGAALFGAAFVEGASAKAGEFGKIGIFGMEDISSPYQPGGPKSGSEATFGYQKTGEWLAKDYEADVTREKADFTKSCSKITALGPYVDQKTWWYVRDELRCQAYPMRENMLAMNKVKSGADKVNADIAYKKFWNEIESFDLACKKKELALAKKEYADVIDALNAYKALV